MIAAPRRRAPLESLYFACPRQRPQALLGEVFFHIRRQHGRGREAEPQMRDASEARTFSRRAATSFYTRRQRGEPRRPGP